MPVLFPAGSFFIRLVYLFCGRFNAYYMKKWLIGILLLFILLISCAWIFIPRVLTVSSTAFINCNVNGTSRYIGSEDNWVKWWAYNNNNQATAKPFTSNGYTYRISRRSEHAAEVIIERGDLKVSSVMSIISLPYIDSLAIQWKTELESGLNPFKRITQYRRAREIKNNMEVIFSNLRSFLEKKENIYGVDFQIVMSKDSALVATRFQTKAYPTTAEIYRAIGSLKKYVAESGAQEINYPMLHVDQLDSSRFESMVAISANKRLDGRGNIVYKRFVPWKVLTAEVKGGVYTVNEAFRQMEIYMADYHMIGMAIPFESLITDRSLEPDTLKWVTRIYVPVP